jgi:hypothetical protein
MVLVPGLASTGYQVDTSMLTRMINYLILIW